MSIKLTIAPVTSTLSTCSPDLMPFHIDYSGQASVSTYMRVEPAKETVGAPAMDRDHTGEAESGPSASPANETTANGAENSQRTEIDTSQSPNAPPSLPQNGTTTRPESRFISTFRGRTIHGLDIYVPEGYTGLVLRVDNDGNPFAGPSKTADRQYEENSTTKFKRVTRRTNTLASKDEAGGIELEMSEKVVRDVEMVDLTGVIPEEEEDDGLPRRTLVPSAQFSSFRLWAADFPADEGADEYARSLTEWISLAHHIHQVPP